MYRAATALAAMATFAAVYWLTPAPAYLAEPAPVPVAQALPLAEASGAVRSPAAAPVVPARAAAGSDRSRSVRPPVERMDPVYYPGCNAVRAAGLAPLYRGQPGYRPEMDGDDDGIACEPHRTF